MKNNKAKGFLHLLIVIAVIALFSVVTLMGVGKGHKGSAENIRLGLDLAGGVSITYEANKNNPTQQEMNDTIHKMQKRVENHSTEAEVYQEGVNRINIDIPNVKDPNVVLEALGKAGSLTFEDPNGKVVIDGKDIASAQAVTQQSQTGKMEHVVKLTLNGSGSKKFANATKEFVGKAISIIYDGETVSSPVVQSEITDGVAIISGNFQTFEEADELASVIRIGALPLELKEIRSNVVGAKLGLESLNTSLLAGGIGFILVVLFMIIFYRIPGLCASLALVFYVTTLLLGLNYMDVTLTLPGVAGIILTIGMAVDANIVIFSRIREELAVGKPVRSAIKIGFDKALSAIIDGNVTTIIAALVLWMMGSGTVKGFAQTLGIGIVLSMFSALVVTKFILNAFVKLGCENVKLYGVQKERKVINFVGNAKKYFAVSIAMIVICFGALITNQVTTGSVLNYGLEFKGGTSTEVTFAQDTTIDDSFKQDFVNLIKDVTGEVAEISEIEGANAILAKTGELNQTKRKELAEKLKETYGVTDEEIQTESISGSVSSEMKKDAFLSVVIASLAMLVYIWIRFKDLKFGASSVAALVHDVLVVLMIYAVFSRLIPVGNTFIACMLTIVGYSINSTIVIFDRIRENLKGTRGRTKEKLAEVVNTSVTQTLGRSINTSITTFFMVVMLVILGVDAVRQFAIPLMVGIICGAFSSVCIAGNLWYFMKTRKMKEDVR